MGEVISELKNWGCDISGALDRFLDDEELYISCLHTVIYDPAYEKLGEALNAQQIADAFEYAHTLKGVLANMGLTPIYDIAVRIVEPLRAGNGENLIPVYEELLAANARLKSIINE